MPRSCILWLIVSYHLCRKVSLCIEESTATCEHADKAWLMSQVRVDAVVALRCFVDAFSEAEAAALKPLIPALLDEFFKLMNEVRAQISRVTAI